MSTRQRFRPRTEPYAFQAAAHRAMLHARKGSPGFALWCEPGTGKTKMALDFMGQLWSADQLDIVLVLAPKGVHRQWVEDQIPLHVHEPHQAAVWWRGTNFRPRWRAHGDQTAGPLWVCMNYDAIKTATGAGELRGLLHRKRFGLVLDESHFVKNHRAQRYRAVAKLAANPRCRARLLLSGTPVTKDLADEWAQLKIADERIVGIRYLGAFRNEFCVMGGFENRKFIAPRNHAEYQRRTAPFIFRATKRELKGLPKKVYRRWYFDMTPAQRRLYRDMAADLLAQLDDGAFADAANAAVKVLRLQQISCGFVTPEDAEPRFVVPEAKNPRLLALRELLDAAVPVDAPVIVWCRFRWDVAAVNRYLGALTEPAMVHGGMSATARRASIDRWLKGRARVLIATPGAAGTGFNLQGRCQTAIYYSNSEHYTHRVQSEDRIHRIGATGPVAAYWDLVAHGSRDLAILRNLRAKKDISSLVLDDFRRDLRSVIAK